MHKMIIILLFLVTMTGCQTLDPRPPLMNSSNFGEFQPGDV